MNGIHMKKVVIGSLLTVLVLWTPCFAGEPREKIKQTTEKILAILRDPALKTIDKSQERKRLIREAVDERFDWEEMSRRTLARHWAACSAAEKEEFISLYAKLLERTYLDKVEGYSGEEVNYGNELIDGNYASVEVGIVSQQGKEIKVLYRLKQEKEDWYVYDISIEGVSLVNNYRTQFNSIILRSSFQELMEKLRKKVADE